MPSALDLYDFYLEPEDLKSQSHAVKITAVKPEPIFDPISKRDVQKLVLTFEGKKKVMPLNKTQVGALMEITKTDDYSKWVGVTITITPAIAPNKKSTIAITQHPAVKA